MYPLYISSPSYLYAGIIFGLMIDGIPGSRLAGMVVLMTLDSRHSLAHCNAATEWVFILTSLFEKWRQFGAQFVPTEMRFQLKWRLFCDEFLV